MLELAYRNLSSNKGSMTAGIDGGTLDGTSESTILELAQKLERET